MEILIDDIPWGRPRFVINLPEDLYNKGDVRSCAYPECLRPVLYTGNNWVHLPLTDSERRVIHTPFIPHSGRPYPEHKHRLTFLRVDIFSYFFECSVCKANFEYDRRIVHKRLLEGW